MVPEPEQINPKPKLWYNISFRLFYERDFSKSLDASVVQVDGEMDWVILGSVEEGFWV